MSVMAIYRQLISDPVKYSSFEAAQIPTHEIMLDSRGCNLLGIYYTFSESEYRFIKQAAGEGKTGHRLTQ